MATLSTRQMKDLYGGGPDDDNVIVVNPSLDKILAEVKVRPKRGSSQEIERQRMERWLADKTAKGRSVEIVTITPVLATLLLERNTKNRPIAHGNVNVLERDAIEGRFEFNGESVIVSEDGSLIDGQHRCQAVVRTGVPIETVIVFGVPDKARRTVDIGRARSAANVLAMEYGVEEAGLVATVTKMILSWRTFGHIAKHGKHAPTKTQVIDAHGHLTGIEESLKFCNRKRASLVAPRTVLAFCHWAFAQRASREDADRFMARLIDGDRPRDGDPILYVRDRLLGITKWVFPQDRVSLIFQAWNLWRTGRPFAQIKTKSDLPPLER